MGAWIRLSPVAEKRSVVVTGCGSGSGGERFQRSKARPQRGQARCQESGSARSQSRPMPHQPPAALPSSLRKTGFVFAGSAVRAANVVSWMPRVLPVPFRQPSCRSKWWKTQRPYSSAIMLPILYRPGSFCKIDSSIYCAICKTLREYAVCLRVMTSSGPQNSTSWSPTMLPPRTELMPISLGSRFWRTEERS